MVHNVDKMVALREGALCDREIISYSKMGNLASAMNISVSLLLQFLEGVQSLQHMHRLYPLGLASPLDSRIQWLE